MWPCCLRQGHVLIRSKLRRLLCLEITIVSRASSLQVASGLWLSETLLRCVWQLWQY